MLVAPRKKSVTGFTLVELVVTIVLTTIVASFAAMFIVTPVNSYRAQARRADMVDSADAVLRLMSRDIRSALPNSVRILRSGNLLALELLASVDGVRYRDSGATGNPNQELDFTSPDGSFGTMSQFNSVTRGVALTNYYLSVYNVGIPGADAYQLTNVITPAGTSITINSNGTLANEDIVTVSPAFKFAYGSPAHRIYLVSGPVTYLCDEAGNTIRRYSGYSINSSQANRINPSDLTTAGATSAMIANNVVACQFDYAAGTAQRSGLVSLRVTMTNSGESIWLAHQVHVENAP